MVHHWSIDTGGAQVEMRIKLSPGDFQADFLVTGEHAQTQLHEYPWTLSHLGLTSEVRGHIHLDAC